MSHRQPDSQPDHRDALNRIKANAELSIDMLGRHGNDLTPMRVEAVLGDLERIKKEVVTLLLLAEADHAALRQLDNQPDQIVSTATRTDIRLEGHLGRYPLGLLDALEATERELNEVGAECSRLEDDLLEIRDALGDDVPINAEGIIEAIRALQAKAASHAA